LVWDRLTPVVQRIAHRQIAVPVIIKTAPGRVMELYQEILPYLPRVSELVYREIAPYHIYRPRLMPEFNMISQILPREIVFDLAEHPHVERIYHDQLLYALQYPTVGPDEVYTVRRAFKKTLIFTSTLHTKRLIGADRANEKGFTGNGVKVAVLDTGANRQHPQLRGKVYHYSVMHYFMDDNGHGTWCISCILGDRAIDRELSMEAGKDVICEGMAPEAEGVSIKCLGYVIGAGSTSGILDAVRLAMNQGVDVISMSLGGPEQATKPEDDPALSVFEEVVKHNIIPVVAAGNEGPDEKTIGTPGALPQVLTVGAYDPIKGEIAEFSSRGPTPWGDIKPDCVAPGVNIDSASVFLCDFAGDNRPNFYGVLSGTSMATPHVAGLVVLMRQAMYETTGNILTVDEIKRMLSELGHEKNNIDGWGPITWSMFEEWMSTQYGVEL